jgi:hypothetical protein
MVNNVGCRLMKAIINFTPGPQGLNLSPRRNLHPRGEHSLLFRRMENFTPMCMEMPVFRVNMAVDKKIIF